MKHYRDAPFNLQCSAERNNWVTHDGAAVNVNDLRHCESQDTERCIFGKTVALRQVESICTTRRTRNFPIGRTKRRCRAHSGGAFSGPYISWLRRRSVMKSWSSNERKFVLPAIKIAPRARNACSMKFYICRLTTGQIYRTFAFSMEVARTVENSSLRWIRL